MKKVGRKIVPRFTLFFFLCTLYSVLCTTTVSAQTPAPWAIMNPRCVDPANPDVATIQGLECVFANILRVLTPLVGLIMFIMLIVGSFQMLTAGGEAKQVQKARMTLTYAIAGMVLFLGIWFILLFIKAVTGVDVTRFEIPGPQ